MTALAQFQAELDDAALLAAIDRMLAVLAQPAELMREVGAKLETNAQQRFDSHTDPSGQPWAPLAWNTIQIYRSAWFIKRNPEFKGGIPGSLLQHTNALRRSLAFNAGDDWVEIGTLRTVPGRSQPTWQVGWLHETGTRTMPPRRILTADPATGTLGAGDQADVLAIVNGALGAAWG